MLFNRITKRPGMESTDEKVLRRGQGDQKGEYKQDWENPIKAGGCHQEIIIKFSAVFLFKSLRDKNKNFFTKILKQNFSRIFF